MGEAGCCLFSRRPCRWLMSAGAAQTLKCASVLPRRHQQMTSDRTTHCSPVSSPHPGLRRSIYNRVAKDRDQKITIGDNDMKDYLPVQYIFLSSKNIL
jgi:hypothetical protein